ncbi:oxygen-independent coproporphyrinogen-3 oxidase [Dethiosulfatibacter aminovorans DSM 17477]|uniref:Oxygen-independent coproporphyrinogen-3 oxidase n=1 Tax=Dethiosulfatibacter aminovorans DSM 17477 TaxID=1121476 RepID=A0A1M6D4J7_9FIRM|nr:coproporphyrinogen dehydrogenase HemZ [Dethiosulfatibacter aminovorans]SHI68166.1 oxygen-independent coproporphyrinogen-3 oxidase [Dethiosulfatibacter aminovorans DSM 17477]
MINVTINSHKYSDSIFNTVRIFDKVHKISINKKDFEADKDNLDDNDTIIDIDINLDMECTAVSRLAVDSVFVCEEGTSLEDLEFLNKENNKNIQVLLRHNLYRLLSRYYETTYSYGILTGVRPVKIIRIAAGNGYDRRYIARVLKETFLLKENTIENLFRVYETESKLLAKNKTNASLYIGIPFCPTKCNYCSFTSYVGKSEEEIENYIDILIEEIKQNADISEEFDLDVQSIYIGGGTPGILNDKMTYKLLESIRKNFKIKDGLEFTMESGRPKTITNEKLKIMKDMGVNRISINPQTMNNDTLKLVNRDHTAEDIMEAFDIARAAGFETINADFIIGLPGEGMEDAYRNIDFIKDYRPENVTVHNLAVKRGSYYHNKNYVNQRFEKVLDEINELYKRSLEDLGMNIYYLYRQKNIRNNADNFGYTCRGHESIYNINIIEEIQTILAMGAGSASKIVDPYKNKIHRVGNNKDLKTYSEKLEQVYLLKKKLISQILTDTQ